MNKIITKLIEDRINNLLNRKEQLITIKKYNKFSIIGAIDREIEQLKEGL